MPRFALMCILMFAVAVTAPAARADIDGNRYSSKTWRIRIDAPRNWKLTGQSSYPNILAWMVSHKPKARMLLAAEIVGESTTVETYADKTKSLLESLGFTVSSTKIHVSTGAYWFEFDNKTVYLRQAFLFSNGIAYSLTLSTDSLRHRAQQTRDFDYALRSIHIERPATTTSVASPESADSANSENAVESKKTPDFPPNSKKSDRPNKPANTTKPSGS